MAVTILPTMRMIPILLVVVIVAGIVLTEPTTKNDYEKFKSLKFTEKQQKFVEDTNEELFWHFGIRLKKEHLNAETRKRIKEELNQKCTTTDVDAWMNEVFNVNYQTEIGLSLTGP